MNVTRKPSVLFVCVENSCRSQLAEALARMIAEDTVEVLSAGSRPSGRINPVAIEVMQELGYNLSSHISKSIDSLKNEKFDCIVTMGCGDACPMLTTGWREDWTIPDCKEMRAPEMRQIRDQIRSKVTVLLRKLRR